MKKLFLAIMVAIMAAVELNAQTLKGEGALLGNVGYQTNYQRFGLEFGGGMLSHEIFGLHRILHFFP